MEVALLAGQKKLPPTPWGYLPPRMRVLLIAGPLRTGGWLADALAQDSASDVQLETIVGLGAGLARLRDERFDAVLVSHEPGELDGWEALDAIRAGVGEDQALVVLGDCADDELTVYCLESGGDAYLCTRTATTRSLLWVVARAIERHTLIAEHRQLRHAQQQRWRREHDESRQQLEQRRSMIAVRCPAHHASAAVGEPFSPARAGVSSDLPEPLVQHYRELLRAYVIMGTGHLADKLTRWIALLADANLSPRDVMELHLHALEQLIADLGARSARHVMNRADLLSLEVMMSLADQYRAKAGELTGPSRPGRLSGGDA